MQIKPALPQNDSRLEALERRIAELEQTLASLEVGDPGCNTDHRTPKIVRDTRDADAQVRDTSDAQVRDTRVDPPARPTTPPAASPPAASPPAASPETTPTSAPRRLYQLSSPTQPPSYTQYWSQASHATEGVSNSYVRAIYRAPVLSKSNACWVVFFGWEIGVKHKAQVQRATKGFRHSLQQGYPTVSQATKAFQYAQEQGWTSTAPPHNVLMLDIERLPRPLETDDSAVVGDRLHPRLPNDPWYIVYKGVNPGIFPTYLECALNTSGVKGASHEKCPTFNEALGMYRRAKQQGEVAELRTLA